MDTIVQSSTFRPPNVYSETCPTRQVLDLIADKWTTLVIGLLEDEPKRFSQIQRRIEGISQKMLTQTLRGLERDGLITRRVYAEVPPRVEYALTPLGASLSGLLAGLRNWAETNIGDITAAQEQYDNPG
jgi:DNA-binding HxlR family transcriptional regulator